MRNKEESQGTKEQTPKTIKKPYYQQNVELLLDAVQRGKAPFLLQEGNHIKKQNGTVVLTPQPTVRLAMSGKVIKGTNQLIAQIQIDRMNKTEASVLTFEQAEKLGSGIRKGSKSFVITSYNNENSQGNKLAVYHLFSSADAVQSQALVKKLNTVSRLRTTSEKTIICKDSTPEKFLGAYLAAGVSGRTLSFQESTIKQFQEKLQKELETCVSQKKHSQAFELGRKASIECRFILSKELKKERTNLYQYTHTQEITR